MRGPSAMAASRVGCDRGAMTNSSPEDPHIADLMRKLDEVGRRQEAVANILRSLSTGRVRLQPVLDEIVEAATRLCRSDSCLLWLERSRRPLTWS